MARSMILGVLILAVGFVAPAAGETMPGLSETTMLLDTLKGISKTHEIDFKGMHKVVDGRTSLVHGEIQERLRHLLTAYNYVIIESPEATVERIIILGHIETRAISTGRIEVKIVDELPRRISGAKCVSPAGGSLLGALLPVSHDGVRLSSSYGMRRHPIRGYSAMHRGVDFAAPEGTPVYAASDGFVVEKDRRYGYGNIIRLRHDSRIETIYAHLSRFALGIQEGIRVKQGEVIGYVGSTGQATGPHLHYEVLFDGRQVDPNGVSLPPCAKSAKTLAY